MRERLAQLARTKVAGVPLPVLFVVLVLIAAVIIHRRRVKAASPQDASNLADTSSSVGAMANGGYAGQDYSFPVPAGSGDTVDTTGSDFGGLTNPEASGTTVTGTPTPSTSAPGAVTPPKVSPAKSAHPAGKSKRPKPAPKPVHKAAAPPKKTTVHKAPVAKKPVTHKPAHKPAPKPPAHKPAPAKKPAAHKPAKKPAHRRPPGMPRNATL